MRSPPAGLALLLAAGCSREPEPAPAPPPPAAVDPFRERSIEAGRRLSAARGPAEQQRWVGVLASYGSDPNPQVALPALEALVHHVKASVAKREGAAVDVALDAILRIGHAERHELLHAVLASRLEPWVRCNALDRLADALGSDSMPLLLDSLADAELRGTAAVRIGLRSWHSRDADLLRRLAAAGDSEKNPGCLGLLAWALRVVGGDDVRPLLATWVERLEGWYQTDVAWFVHRTDPWGVVDRLVESKLIPFAPRPEDLNSALAGRDETPAPVSQRLVTEAFLGTGGLVRDSAHGLYEPLDYPRWLRRFAVQSRGLFKPEKIAREKDVVTFEQGGRSYPFTVADRGDWYDLPPVLDAVNRALEDADVPERFVGLDGGRQVAVFILVVPDRFREFAGEFQIPLEPDPDAPRKRWQVQQEERRGK